MMEFKQLTVEDIVKKAVGYDVELMGDDMVGFKFVGQDSEFWNSVLKETYDNGADVGSVLNTAYFLANNIKFSDYNSEIWSQ